MTWAFFTHLGNGVRHFWMDLGAGFELKRNRIGALAVFAFGIVATVLTWAYILTKGTM
jgi:succinate dehydrogenase / fumarate reductase cytochrome b subunit